MTATPGGPENGDDVRAEFDYGHARMPGFMKIAWIGFLVFIAWYVASFLIPAAGRELGG
ncbi:MAG: hypothetical protein HMLKMBBP_01481 [Planctomycetes bacterium]|nr:hypothetical protein [Planctomycetota bacterium]